MNGFKEKGQLDWRLRGYRAIRACNTLHVFSGLGIEVGDGLFLGRVIDANEVSDQKLMTEKGNKLGALWFRIYITDRSIYI